MSLQLGNMSWSNWGYVLRKQQEAKKKKQIKQHSKNGNFSEDVIIFKINCQEIFHNSKIW